MCQQKLTEVCRKVVWNVIKMASLVWRAESIFCHFHHISKHLSTHFGNFFTINNEKKITLSLLIGCNGWPGPRPVMVDRVPGQGTKFCENAHCWTAKVVWNGWKWFWKIWQTADYFFVTVEANLWFWKFPRTVPATEPCGSQVYRYCGVPVTKSKFVFNPLWTNASNSITCISDAMRCCLNCTEPADHSLHSCQRN